MIYLHASLISARDRDEWLYCLDYTLILKVELRLYEKNATVNNKSSHQQYCSISFAMKGCNFHQWNIYVVMLMSDLESFELPLVQIRLRATYMYVFLCIELFWITRQAKYVKRKMETLSHVHCCCGKAVRFTYSECVPLALVFRHAKCMRRIIFSSVAYLLLTYFSTGLLETLYWTLLRGLEL